MAHPRRSAALDRKALTVGLTAALLAFPMAGMSGAVTLEGSLTEAEIVAAEALGLDTTLLTDEQVRTLLDTAAGTTTDAVKSAVDNAVKVAPAPVADTVDKAVKAAPAPVAEVIAPGAPAPTAPGGGSAGTAGDGNVQPVPAPEQRSSTSSQRSAPADARPAASSGVNTAPAPSISNDLRTTAGFSSSTTDRPNLQPASPPPPLVSTPFTIQAPQVGEAVQTPLTALSAAPSIVADAFEAVAATTSTSTTPLSEHPSGVPGALTATAAALLLMVGAGHVLHRNGTFRTTLAR